MRRTDLGGGEKVWDGWRRRRSEGQEHPHLIKPPPAREADGSLEGFAGLRGAQEQWHDGRGSNLRASDVSLVRSMSATLPFQNLYHLPTELSQPVSGDGQPTAPRSPSQLIH